MRWIAFLLFLVPVGCQTARPEPCFESDLSLQTRVSGRLDDVTVSLSVKGKW